jgi:alpha-tubulin suppressor-like RCC1 family protein
MPSGASGAASLALGAAHSCVLSLDGAVYCWGSDYEGELGPSTQLVQCPDSNDVACSLVPLPVLTGAAAITAGWQHACALMTDGTIQCWGANDQGQLGRGFASAFSSAPRPVLGPANQPIHAQEIAAGGRHTCALSGGDVYCWGGVAYVDAGTPGAQWPSTATKVAFQ